MTFGRNLESQFTQFRNAIKQGLAAEEIQKRHLDIEAKLAVADANADAPRMNFPFITPSSILR